MRRFLDSRPASRAREGERGFTFIEIMVVVAILAILAALVVPRIMGRTDDAKRTAAKVQIRNIEGALQLYKLDNRVYPTSEQGLKARVEKPSVGVIPKQWKIGGYIDKLPEDPWGNPYKYQSPAPIQQGQYGQIKADYEILSLGTDGEVGGGGVNADIANWNVLFLPGTGLGSFMTFVQIRRSAYFAEQLKVQFGVQSFMPNTVMVCLAGALLFLLVPAALFFMYQIRRNPRLGAVSAPHV